MAALDWSQCPAVESIPGKVSGAWAFRDTRMPVAIVFQNLEAGATVEEIMEWFDLTREQLRYRAKNLRRVNTPEAKVKWRGGPDHHYDEQYERNAQKWEQINACEVGRRSFSGSSRCCLAW
jgi:uncharacterized protein (DUF433 family)